MHADNRYFMTSVKLHEVKHLLESCLNNLEQGLPSIELMSAAARDLMDAIVEAHKARLSDKSFQIRPGCTNKCGYDAIHCGRDDCK